MKINLLVEMRRSIAWGATVVGASLTKESWFDNPTLGEVLGAMAVLSAFASVGRLLSDPKMPSARVFVGSILISQSTSLAVGLLGSGYLRSQPTVLMGTAVLIGLLGREDLLQGVRDFAIRWAQNGRDKRPLD